MITLNPATSLGGGCAHPHVSDQDTEAQATQLVSGRGPWDIQCCGLAQFTNTCQAAWAGEVELLSLGNGGWEGMGAPSHSGRVGAHHTEPAPLSQPGPRMQPGLSS